MYVDLVQPLLSDQEVIATGMMGELQRCQLAIDRALAGAKVALVSSGDVGVYGMAGLALEICQERGLRLGPLSGGPEVDLPLEVIPGVPALAAAAALLGAPLMHDFVSVSLSDLLTPWEIIKKRLESAAAADFVIVIYNPKSKKRDWQLGAVREMVLQHRADQRLLWASSAGPCGKARKSSSPAWERCCSTRWICRLLSLSAIPRRMRPVAI